MLSLTTLSPQQELAPDWVSMARRAVEFAAQTIDPVILEALEEPTFLRPENQDAQPAAELSGYIGAVVTLHSAGALRGCMGSVGPGLPIKRLLREAAACAASRDPRFEPVRVDELEEITICVSLISQPKPMRSLDDLELGRHGITVGRGDRYGLFLPQAAIDPQLPLRVFQEAPGPAILGMEQFLSLCCTQKAGLEPDAWREPTCTVEIFEAAVFVECEPA